MSNPNPDTSGLRPPWKKGESGNPNGRKAYEWKAMRKLRSALSRDADEIHAALMELVREKDTQAVIYAHKQVVGEPPPFVRATKAVDTGKMREDMLEAVGDALADAEDSEPH